MRIRQDKLKPSQPYFVLDSTGFKQEIYLKQGISHFYSFELTGTIDLKTVPDGCVDLIFEYCENDMKAYAYGTVLTFSSCHWEGHGELFGIRFLPGVLPAGINAVMKDLINKRVLLYDLMSDTRLIERMSKETEFYQRIRVFLEEYTHLEKKQVRPYGKAELCAEVKSLVYNSDGLIKISALAEKTGYTERYINKVFIEFMGFSPKTFCKIIQFQNAIETLNYGPEEKMTKVAMDLGYYDQAKFIRDFKKYAGITPSKYLKLVEEGRYKQVTGRESD